MYQALSSCEHTETCRPVAYKALPRNTLSWWSLGDDFFPSSFLHFLISYYDEHITSIK